MSPKRIFYNATKFFTIVFTTLQTSSGTNQNTIKLQHSELVEKFNKANDVEDSYLLKYDVLGKNYVLRCEVEKGEPIKIHYDDTFAPKEMYLIEKAGNHLNDVFQSINPEYTIETSFTNQGKTYQANEIFVTKDNDGVLDKRKASGMTSFDLQFSKNGGFKESVEQVQMNGSVYNKDNEDGYNDFYTVLLHEFLHCFGIGDAYLLCDQETKFMHASKGDTLMDHQSSSVILNGIGKNDYKLLCGLYGNYTEETLTTAYKEKIDNFRDYEFYHQKYSEGIKATEYIKSRLNKFLQEKGIDTKISDSYAVKFDIIEPVYLKNVNTNNLLKLNINDTYETFNSKTKTLKQQNLEEQFYLNKVNENTCLLKTDDYYFTYDIPSKTFTNIYKVISEKEYNDTVIQDYSIEL